MGYGLPYINYAQVEQWNLEKVHNFMMNNAYHKGVLKKNEEVMLNSDEGVMIYLISGRLKVYGYNQYGEERLCYFLEPYNSCYAQYGNDDRIGLRFVATQKSAYFLIKSKIFFSEWSRDREAMEAVFRGIEQRIGSMMYYIVQVGQAGKFVQFCRLIYSMAYRYPVVEGKIKIPNFPSQNDIGEIVGIHKSNVSKYFSRLEELGIVSRERRALVIYQLESLEKIVVEHL